MLKRSVLSAALAASLALVACGGSDSEDSPQPGPGPGPAPAGDRIEPLDTATLPRSAEVKAVPAAVSRLPSGAVAQKVTLGPLPAAVKIDAADKGVALQIGKGRPLPATASAAALASQLRWYPLTNGAQVAALSFAAEGAQAIRLGVLASKVPAGAVLRFYGAPGTEVVEMSADELQRLRQINEAAGLAGDAARMMWGPDTEGALSTLEIELPPGVAADALQMAVPQLLHLTQSVQQALMPRKDTSHIGNSGSCNLDVMCTAELQAESRAVAKMTYVKDGNGYLCTGTLMNDARNSRTPYFLTAAHCIDTQAAASTLVTYWFFRSASCGSSPDFDRDAQRMVGGARLLYTSDSVDTTLLQLNSAPPDNVVYAGSYFGRDAVPGVGVVGVHHPRGDLQKYSVGSVDGYGNCNSQGCSSASASNGGMLRIGWSSGTTEGGSSGSAIFAQHKDTGLRYVIGALHGGNASCSNREGSDFYGRFEISFAAGINQWLTR